MSYANSTPALPSSPEPTSTNTNFKATISAPLLSKYALRQSKPTSAASDNRRVQRNAHQWPNPHHANCQNYFNKEDELRVSHQTHCGKPDAPDRISHRNQFWSAAACRRCRAVSTVPLSPTPHIARPPSTNFT